MYCLSRLTRSKDEEKRTWKYVYLTVFKENKNYAFILSLKIS